MCLDEWPPARDALANRSEQKRPDVIDTVLAEHAAVYESPTDEPPIVFDAQATRDPEQLRVTARAVLTAPRS